MYFGWLLGLGLAASAAAQTTCDNFGTAKSDGSCECPPGFGGSTCNAPSCGGNLFNGAQRPVSQNSSTGGMSFAGCSCQDGWGGAGCNVCRSENICQTAFTAAGGSSSSASSPSPLSANQVGNQTLTCNTLPRVYAAQEMSCAVINPTLQALFPLSANLNILRTLDPSLSPTPNTTSFGSAGSAFAQLFYDGVEQFYCQAGGCKQTFSNDTTDWACESLKCSCRPGTAFCGAQKSTDLTSTLNSLSGALGVTCTSSTATCAFKQSLLQALFGSGGLGLSNCVFGECVRQSVINSALGITPEVASTTGESLSGGVIAGLAVLGAIALGVAILLAWGCVLQRRARSIRNEKQAAAGRRVGVEWKNVRYIVQPSGSSSIFPVGGLRRRHAVPVGSTSLVELRDLEGSGGEPPLPAIPSQVGNVKSKMILSGLSGSVRPGQMLAILGPSGAGKTTLIGILAGRSGAMGGRVSGDVGFTVDGGDGRVKVGFVDQTDVLPSNLTVTEALLFAAKLKLPESTSPAEKVARVEHVIRQLGLSEVAHSRIGGNTERGLSGGERRRVSIALEIVAGVEVLILDEPTSGLDSVSAANVARVLAELAHDPENPVAVIASIHQPSSRLYHQFDQILLLSRGKQVYFGPGGVAPVRSLESRGVRGMEEGYNVADWLLEVASEGAQPVSGAYDSSARTRASVYDPNVPASFYDQEHGITGEKNMRYRGGKPSIEEDSDQSSKEEPNMIRIGRGRGGQKYAATFLTQVQVLCGREWKNLQRDKTLFYMHLAVACILGLFTGGLYFKVGVTISGFQNRIGSLFFMGSLLAFSSLSALYNLVEVRPLFARERAGGYYSPAAWLVSRVLFDVLPLRIIPTIVLACITYWMVGLSPEAARFFKALLVLVLYALAMTLFNFLLASSFRNGGIAILLSALFNLFTMTYAGFFVNLSAIPPVLRWLQYFSILKYLLEALAVNEVGSGLMIQDTLQGVPVNVSASLIMELLFGFGGNNYYRDVLILFAWIVGLGAGVVGMVYWRLREVR
ncbi:putative ATP-dependent permease [Rhizoctonia solani]|uniref:Putative ATP-dependent permease n=1 Tax=Rhizoctonia solani TaxID=456999 RepID=A0A0K6FWG0_9AGAM|nr:putative ATP-dependent permease [Rhizoctonia solani]